MMTTREPDAPASGPTAVLAAVRCDATRTQKIVPLHPLPEGEALAWLRTQPGGRITASNAELGRRWGWHRQRVGRRLKAWAMAGYIKRRGDTVTAISAEAATSAVTRTVTNGVTSDVTNGVTSGSSGPVTGSEPTRVRSQRDSAPLITAEQRAGLTATWLRRGGLLLGSTLVALALVIAGVGIAINSWFAASLGKTAEAALLFAAVGMAADALAFLLPTVASHLAQARRYASAMVAWLLWTATVTFALLASAGFVGLNVSDVMASRAREALGAQALSVRIERLQSERAAITEMRSVAALEAELQATQPNAASVWKQTDGCRNVTIVISGQACAAVLQVRQRLAEAHRRDAIDSELRAAEAQISYAPAISGVDPQAATAANLVNWLSAGLTNVTTTDIGMLRVALITLLPQCAGLVLMLALNLLGAPRPALKHDSWVRGSDANGRAEMGNLQVATKTRMELGLSG